MDSENRIGSAPGSPGFSRIQRHDPVGHPRPHWPSTTPLAIHAAGSIGLAALLFLGGNASGQPLHLSANQSYSYEFQRLPLNNDFHLGVPGRYGYFGLALGGDLLTAGESARMDYFESSLSDP